ncbi:MAG TPA: hypothetical protein VHE34_09815 [Puia sp.]|uniref:hypothetical protein n=1 Tax=Puia sp. TaxID=2045100 RepID=UPI002C17B6B6|nr:hypothetical protein [Puia sp.]HVU95511.1 hypothetical protein [Puia sp.]
MRSLVGTSIITISLLAPGRICYAQKANFSGSWQLDQQRTELGNIPASAASNSIKVDQRKDSIFIERIGTTHVLEGLPMNGMAAQVRFYGGTKMAAVEFVTGGLSMEESASYILDSAAIPGVVYPLTSKEVWTLSDSDRTLQIVRTVSTVSNGNYSIKAVYTKQD